MVICTKENSRQGVGQMTVCPFRCLDLLGEGRGKGNIKNQEHGKFQHIPEHSGTSWNMKKN